MMGYHEDGEKEGEKDNRFFVEGYSSSESELGFSFNHHQYSNVSKKQTERASRITRDPSPPLVLAFSLSTGRALQDSSHSPLSSPGLHPGQDQELEYSDDPLEEWMILGGEELEGDGDIQLNLGYWSSSSSSDDSGDEDQKPEAVEQPWAISDKDKWGTDQPLLSRYFTPDRTLTCHNYNKTGHLAKSCTTPKKRPICVLCGLQGHLLKGCTGRHCPSCGLPSHGLRPCLEPPVWDQHCQRCGTTGHLSDACPDTWRQYHLTTQGETPHRPWRDHAHRRVQRPAHCYNCSRIGHHGYECTRRRMVSGMCPSVPYVCHYDTQEDILQQRTKMQRRTEGDALGLQAVSPMPPSERQCSSKPAVGGSSKEDQPAQGICGSWRRDQEARSREGRRKTWPEMRKERREVKRLRREAQARREGGILGRSKGGSDDNDTHPRDPFSRTPSRGHRDPTPPPQKKRRSEKSDGRSKSKERSRKSREAERWKKRGGMKRGDLYPHDGLGATDQNLLSPTHRVRQHRR